MTAMIRDALDRDALAPVEALSPIDGRYRAATAPCGACFPSRAHSRADCRGSQWLLHLAASVPALAGSHLPAAVRERAEQLARQPDADSAEAVKGIEARINHDVKAVEYYVREQFAKAGASEATLELVHFGCTSEDINNLSYAVILREARRELCKTLETRINELLQFAQRYADTAMLARNSRTTGEPDDTRKEFANIVARLRRARQRWESVVILGKWNVPSEISMRMWQPCRASIGPRSAAASWNRCSCQYNSHTTQIEPHDWIAEYCDAVAALNVVLIDLSRDVWGIFRSVTCASAR